MPFFFARISPLLTAAGHLLPLFLGNEVGIYCCDAVLAPSTAVQLCFNIKPFPFIDSIANVFQKKSRNCRVYYLQFLHSKLYILPTVYIYLKKRNDLLSGSHQPIKLVKGPHTQPLQHLPMALRPGSMEPAESMGVKVGKISHSMIFFKHNRRSSNNKKGC